MYWLELQDIMFLINCLKDSPDNFEITSHISFASSATRASQFQSFLPTTRHFYYNRVVLLWNSLASAIDLDLSFCSIKRHITNLLWDHFVTNFDPDIPCSFHNN